jgi:hypothetical protein
MENRSFTIILKTSGHAINLRTRMTNVEISNAIRVAKDRQGLAELSGFNEIEDLVILTIDPHEIGAYITHPVRKQMVEGVKGALVQ